MGRFFAKDQRGVGHTAVIIAIVVVLAVGGVGWWVWNKNQNTPLKKAINNAECSYADKDICKFFAAWKVSDNYSIESESVTGEETVKSVIKVEGKDKTAAAFTGAVNYETIVIGDTLYTKAGDTWYKRTLTAEEASLYDNEDLGLDEPTSGSTTTYTKVGTEQCGKYTCYKYQIVDSTAPDLTQYMWFDTKDYRLRKVEATNAEGTKYTAVFAYDKVSISEPSPVKELAANQYIVPGDTEPTTMPAAGDTPDLNNLSEEELNQLLEQYQ